MNITINPNRTSRTSFRGLGKLPEEASSAKPLQKLLYLTKTDTTKLAGVEVENRADIEKGLFEDSFIRRSLNCYGDSKTKNVSCEEGTYVGMNATLDGGSHSYLNIQDNAKVTNTKAEAVVLYGKAKISESTASEYVELNDATTAHNVKTDKIIVNCIFCRVKGEKTECQKLEAPFVWRILHLDFRTKISPKQKAHT